MPKYRTTIPSGIPKEFCQCGCGTPYAPSRKRANSIFIRGHNARIRRHHLTILERLEERSIKIPNGCWLWLGAYSGQMHYGDIYIKDRHCYTHRVSYELFHGSIPEEILVCHTCDIPRCWNPLHLFLGTHKENIQDCIKKKRHVMFTHPEKLSHPGEESANAKLNNYLVMQIRFLSSTMTAEEIRHILDCKVQVGAIKDVIQRRTWRHVS